MARTVQPVDAAVGFAVLLAAAAHALAIPSPLSACSMGIPPVVLFGVPARDEHDVPTDTVLTFNIPARIVVYGDGADDEVPGTFSLENAAGDVVEVTPQRLVSDVFELRPARALEPMTEYVLRAEWTVDKETYTDELHFTTGAGPSTEPEGPPDAQLDQLLGKGPPLSSCFTPGVGACISVDEDRFFELAPIDAGGEAGEAILSFAPYFWTEDLTGFLSGEPSCLRLRVRGANGVFGEATLLCGDDFPVRYLERLEYLTCTPSGLAFAPKEAETTADAFDAFRRDGGSAGNDDAGARDAGVRDAGAHDDVAPPPAANTERRASGCALLPQPASSRTWAAASALLLLALFRRQQR